MRKISIKLRVPLPTIGAFLKAFKARGCSFDRFGRKYLRYKVFT